MSLNVTMRQVRAFIAVAKNESFSKAAREIRLSQPALTMNVRNLEKMLRVRLLDRDTRNVELTEAGKDFLAASERLVSEFDTIMADTSAAGQHLSGEIVVASVPSLASSLVWPVMSQFKELYRGLTVKLFDGDEQNVVHRVRTRQADFGLCGRLMDNPDLKFQPLVRDDFCAIFPQGHPLGDMPRVRLRDLKSHPFLCMGRDTGVRHALENALVRSDLRFNVLCELEQISTLSGMIEAGIGV